MNLGKKIRKIHELLNLTQKNMALELNITQAAYSKIERGEVRLKAEMFIKIAEVLKVSIDQIQGLNENYVLV